MLISAQGRFAALSGPSGAWKADAKRLYSAAAGLSGLIHGIKRHRHFPILLDQLVGFPLCFARVPAQ